MAIRVTEPSQVGEARRKAATLSERLGFAPNETGKAALVVTEAATNLVKHGRGGVILLQTLQAETGRGLEILALDRGPGITNVQEALRDGYSTSGTQGGGLGAIRRMAATFELHSSPQVGTALLARLWAAPVSPTATHRALELGGICLPPSGDEDCGDGWAAHEETGRALVLVIDALGHGGVAAEATQKAIHVFHGHPAARPTAIMELLHDALRASRGAAAAVMEFDTARHTVTFAGIGNISASIASETCVRHCVSHNGIVGHNVRRIESFAYPWTPGAVLVVHSDGLRNRWDLDRYPGLGRRHPSLISGVLYRDFRRTRDDVTVLVARGTTA